MHRRIKILLRKRCVNNIRNYNETPKSYKLRSYKNRDSSKKENPTNISSEKKTKKQKGDCNNLPPQTLQRRNQIFKTSTIFSLFMTTAKCETESIN